MKGNSRESYIFCEHSAFHARNYSEWHGPHSRQGNFLKYLCRSFSCRMEIIMTIYTVKPGDSVYSIARDAGVPPSRIITDNLLTEPGELVVGEDLVITYPNQTYTVKGGDSLSTIADKYGVSLNELYRNNPVLDGSPAVFPGQTLNISYAAPPLGELSTNGYVYPYVDKTTLRRTLPYLTYLSIFTYGIRTDGTLVEPTGGDRELIAMAKEYEVTPVMMLSSLTSDGTFSNELSTRVISDPALRDKVAKETVQTASARGYGGIDLDFEYISGSLADEYADFVGRIKAYAGDGVKIFVSLAPKYSAEQKGLLYEGHDYRSLGEAADFSNLMTYEWGYSYCPAMAVSPLPQVRRVIEYALTEIPANKLQLGMPNYGYNWTLPYIRGESRAPSLSNTEAVALARRKNAAIQYDGASEAPFFTYYDRPAAEPDAVMHEVWFENARSVDAMLRLIPEYGISGVNVWTVMKYFPALWTVLNSLFTIKKLK